MLPEYQIFTHLAANLDRWLKFCVMILMANMQLLLKSLSPSVCLLCFEGHHFFYRWFLSVEITALKHQNYTGIKFEKM